MILSNNKGYALLGAISIAAILSITTLGFLNVVMNEVENEAQSLENDKAFFAAESGLLLGAYWLRSYAAFPEVGMSFMPFTGLHINGCYVDVKIDIYQNGTETAAKIVSEAYDHPTQRTANEFQKRLSYNCVTQTSFWDFTSFFNDAVNNWAGFDNRYFTGRFHLNEALIVHSKENQAVFKGKVTVANEVNDAWDYGDGTHHNNNYDYGVQLNNATSGLTKGETLDLIFAKDYLANQDVIVLPPELINLTTTLPSHTDAIMLPASTDEGTRDRDYRPTFKYNSDGSADYIYHNGSSYNSINYPTIDQKIIYSTNNINVFGRVKGNTTLVTALDKSIAVINDLVYADYDPNLSDNNGVPVNSTNALGLVTGENIIFHHRYVPTINGDYETIIGDLVPPAGEGQIGQLHLTASIIAVTEEGTEQWNKSRTYAYDLHFTGNHFLNEWTDPSTGGGTNGGANDIYFNQDRRLMNIIQPHGFPYIYITTQNGKMHLTLGGWTEKNTF